MLRYDNMKTAVDKVKKGKGRIVNARFAVMCAHYLFDADFCNIASGWEKGVVEKNVQDSRRRIWLDAQTRPFGSFAEMLEQERGELERLLRYCARPPFAMDRLRKAGSELVYRCAKQHSEPAGDKRGGKVDELVLTPLALIDRIAALAAPPGHRATRASRDEPGRAWGGSTGQCRSSPARSRAAQALTGALPVGGVDRPH